MTQSITKYDRSKILKSLATIRTNQERSFHEIKELAAIICKTPVSTIFFSEVDFQPFNTIVGCELAESSLRNFLYATASDSTSEVCIVNDARTNQSLQNNPLVIGDPGVVFYASAPIVYNETIPLGFICVIDFEPRILSEAQIKSLEALSHQVLQLISFQMELDEREKTISIVKAENVFNSKLIERKIFSEKKLAHPAKANSLPGQQLIQSLPGLFLIFDELGQIKQWNSEFLKFSGYSEKETQGLNFSRLFNSENGTPIEEVIRLAIELGGIEGEFTLESKDGNRKPFLLKFTHINCLQNPCLLACGLDLSVVKHAKKELDQSEYKFKSLVQDGGDLIAILSLEGTYTYVSPTSTTILGIHPEEFVGNNAFDFIHFEDLPQVLDDFQALKIQKRISISPFRFRNSSGEWRWVETIVTNMLDDPAIQGVVANSRDVTDKIKTQQELVMSEQRYKAFLESQTNYFIRTDLQGNYTYVNKKFSQEFGWIYEQDILGKNSLSSICDYHHLRVFEVVKFCLDEPGKVFKVELDKPSKTNGEVRTTLWDFFCIQDSNGEPKEIQCSGIDVSETVYYEKELRSSNERFELVNQANSEYIYEFYPNTKRLFLSEKFEEIFGIKRLNESENYDLMEFIRHQEDKGKIRENFEYKVFQSTETFLNDSYRIQRKDGEILWVRDNAVVIRDNEGKPLRVIGSVRDITESHYYQQIDRIERELTSLFMGKNYTLEEVATGFLENLELLFPGMKTSVMEVKGNLVYPVASPSLPQEYLEEISGFPIGENQGSCGSAVFTKSHVFVTDVQHDIRWENCKDLGTKFGFSACWSAPIFNEKGDVVGTFGCYYDSVRAPFKYELYAIERAQRLFNLIFTQYEYLGSLQKNIELFELINQTTKDAIYDWDLINNQLFFGESYTYNFGHRVNPKIPIPIKDWEVLIHPEDQKKAISDLQKFLQNPKSEKWVSEYRFRKSDGSYAFVEEIGTVQRDNDGTPVRMVGVMRDVTAYKGIQQLLDDSTAISKLGGWELDLSKSVMTWTKTGFEIHEVPLDFHTSLENGIALYREDYHEILHQAVSDLINHNQPIDLEAVLVTPTGKEKWVRVKGSCEFMDGKCIKILGSIQDITPRKMYEDSLKSLNLELELRVKELAVSNLELEQFAYVTSHDLQEPLRMVTSFLTLLENKYGNQLDDKAKQYIGFAVDGAKRMRQLILDLLDYSRSGKSAFEKQLVDLNEIVDQVFHFYKRDIEASKGAILYENLPSLQVSNVSIFQVFQNLIENAVKYAQPGIPPIVTIDHEEKESEWLISVKDNGIGIGPEFHEKIFVIFQRLHNRDKYKGTGIGLSIVKKQVESWGGKIWVESTPGQGSTFYFTLLK